MRTARTSNNGVMLAMLARGARRTILVVASLLVLVSLFFSSELTLKSTAFLSSHRATSHIAPISHKSWYLPGACALVPYG